MVSDEGLVAVDGSGILVSLNDPVHAVALPMNKYALVESAVDAVDPPYKDASASISRNCFALWTLKLFVTKAGTINSPW